MSEDRYNAEDIGAESKPLEEMTKIQQSTVNGVMGVPAAIMSDDDIAAPRARGDIPGLKIIDESPFIETPAQNALDDVLDSPLIGGGVLDVDQTTGDIQMSDHEIPHEEVRDMVREAERGEIDYGSENMTHTSLPAEPFDLDDSEANALARDAEMADNSQGDDVDEDMDISSYSDPDDEVDEAAPHDDDIQDSAEGTDSAEAALEAAE